MKKKHALALEQLRDSRNWPTFDRPEFLDQLNALADSSFHRKTTDGYLAAVLIYQQLTEEIILLLLECSDFLIKCAIFPIEIKFENKRERKLTFGHLLEHLKRAVDFPRKQKLIKNCEKLNTIRILLVHRLARKNSIGDINRTARKVKKIYDSIFKIYEGAHEEFRLAFKSFIKELG